MMAAITDLAQLDPDGTYSYADYLTWQFKERVELFRGKIMKMSPAPNVLHQRVSLRLSLQIGNLLVSSPCELFPAPFDVRLYDRKKSVAADQEVFTVVQPDLCIVCDSEKLADNRSCNGAPDLVIEILSPGNTKREMKKKLDLYEEAAVREYWLVHPLDETVLIYVWDENEGYVGLKPFTESAQSAIFPDLVIDLEKLFA